MTRTTPEKLKNGKNGKSGKRDKRSVDDAGAAAEADRAKLSDAQDAFAVWRPNGFRLADVDLAAAMDNDVYEAELQVLLQRVRELQIAFLYNRVTGIIVLEGWDAAGKGGIIRRLTSVMDPRAVRVWPIGAPNARERAEHYLQRFWRRLPPQGELAVFDRSWYGRVLVERVEELASREAWDRAYAEIRAFEDSLAANGFRLVKIFLHVSEAEQARRFRDRLRDPLRRWKLTLEDMRNRARRADYEDAVEEMIRRTSAPDAPWHVIPSESKKFARIAALRTIVDTLGQGLSLDPPRLDPELLARAREELGVNDKDLTLHDE